MDDSIRRGLAQAAAGQITERPDLVRCQCRTFMCRLDALTHCRIRWVCDAHDKAMLR